MPGAQPPQDTCCGSTLQAALTALAGGTTPGTAHHLPRWLMRHQRGAVIRLKHALDTFGGALLADAVGLGKTYAALAVAGCYRCTGVVVPANLRPQWRETARSLGCRVRIYSHEALSRGRRCRPHDLIVVDEAHRFRNAATRRYDTLARSVGNACVLLLTATPVVNSTTDLVSLLRLFLPDNALATLGVRSLEAVTDECARDLVYAMSPLVVARSRQSVPAVSRMLPAVRDSSVIRLPTLEGSLMKDVLRRLKELRFPSVGEKSARSILRLHIHHRLASSRWAALETLNRHLHYIDRAMERAKRGLPLGRKLMRKLFDADDRFQLELEFVADGKPLDGTELEHERLRLLRLIKVLQHTTGRDPKADRLTAILGKREGCKTIVFTSAARTAYSLAETLGWTRVGVVTGKGARIASGKLDSGEVLRLFAPKARGATAPHPSRCVDILVATDLASEGLNLQDADCVVHYDLPWTPLRLEQRLGRIVRLGSAHEHVSVFWFLPPGEIEAEVGIISRIAQKVTSQLAVGVTSTSSAGKGGITGGAFEWRERLVQGRWKRRDRASMPAVAGAGVFVVTWEIGNRRVGEVVAFDDTGSRVTDFETLHDILWHLKEGFVTPPEERQRAALRKLTRLRILEGSLSPVDSLSRRLTRRLLVLARRAGTDRDVTLLDTLDRVLTRVSCGLRIGAARDLADILLLGGKPRARLRRWIVRHPMTCEDTVPGVRLLAAQAVVARQPVGGPPGKTRASAATPDA